MSGFVVGMMMLVVLVSRLADVLASRLSYFVLLHNAMWLGACTTRPVNYNGNTSLAQERPAIYLQGDITTMTKMPVYMR